MDKKTLLKEIKKLKYFKVKENEIKKNIDYYLNNFEQIKKINDIIENAKKSKVYNKSPNYFMKKETGVEYNFPKKWEDLFNLKNEKSDIDRLYDVFFLKK